MGLIGDRDGRQRQQEKRGDSVVEVECEGSLGLKGYTDQYSNVMHLL